MRTLTVFFLAALVLLAPSQAFGWNSTGHMVIGAIAEPRLNPTARQNVRKLLAINAVKKSDTFITAGVWMDDIRAQDIHFYDRWHYHNRAHSPDGTPVPKEAHTDNVAWAIKESTGVLQSKDAPNVEKARALRFLLHTVQDVHQPLHCGSRYTKNLPSGDRGGNDFPLSGAGRYKNLHAYWDAGLGLFEASVERPLPPGEQPIRAIARAITAAYPPDRVPERAEKDVDKWVDEGYRLLTTFCYPPTATPSEAYTAQGREIAKKRAALAGYRLADLLNRIWP